MYGTATVVRSESGRTDASQEPGKPTVVDALPGVVRRNTQLPVPSGANAKLSPGWATVTHASATSKQRLAASDSTVNETVLLSWRSPTQKGVGSVATNVFALATVKDARPIPVKYR